jgi:hypothetical protein
MSALASCGPDCKEENQMSVGQAYTGNVVRTSRTSINHADIKGM